MPCISLQMILGPWTHGEHARTFSGDVDFGPQSTFDRNVAPTFQVRIGTSRKCRNMLHTSYFNASYFTLITAPPVLVFCSGGQTAMV